MGHIHKVFVVVAVVSIAGLLVADSPEARRGPLVSVADRSDPVRSDNISENEVVSSNAELTQSWADEVKQVIARERTQLASLETQSRSATDNEEALAIQKEAERVKIGTMKRILQMQVDRARRAGNEELVKKIEAAIEKIENPPSQAIPIHHREVKNEG